MKKTLLTDISLDIIFLELIDFKSFVYNIENSVYLCSVRERRIYRTILITYGLKNMR